MIFADIIDVLNPATGAGRILRFLRPFSGPWQFMAYAVLSCLLIVLFTSLFYFSLHNLIRKIHKSPGEEKDGEKEGDEEEEAPRGKTFDAIRLILCLYGALAGLAGFVLVQNALHSVRVDAQGLWMMIFTQRNQWVVPLADSLLAAGLLGVVWGWTRLFQVLLVEDIFERFSRLVKLVPYLSFSMILAFMTGTWFFYSNVFPLWWYYLSFGFIYGMIYFFSLKDFKKHIRMHLSQSVEYEEELSLKTISIGGGLVMIVGILLPHLMFHSLSSVYVFALFLCLWIVSIYMTPGKIFRQVKLFPRFASPFARLLNFARYTRKFMLAWMLILIFMGALLGAEVVFDPIFRNPQADLKECSGNLALVGEALDRYEKDHNALPGSSQWQTGSWLQKIQGDNRLRFMPSCPSGGVYILRKFRDRKGRIGFDVFCASSAHTRAGVGGLNPRYDRNAKSSLNKSREENVAKPTGSKGSTP